MSEKLLKDQKPNDLHYDVNKEVGMKRTIIGVPSFKTQMPRKNIIHGIPSCALDPTGHGFVDDATIGLEGQGYGLASYKKGL